MRIPADCLLILGFALANNLDNTGVGIALGVGRVRLSTGVNAWISLITLVITAGAVGLGSGVARFLPAEAARWISALVLCAIGVTIMLPAFSRRKGDEVEGANTVGRVMRNPETADLDGSRHIDLREGTLLGIALSINNVGGGVGAGLLHLSAVWTGLGSAAVSFLVLWAGGRLGRSVGGARAARGAPVVAGALLIAIGLLQLR